MAREFDRERERERERFVLKAEAKSGMKSFFVSSFQKSYPFVLPPFLSLKTDRFCSKEIERERERESSAAAAEQVRLVFELCLGCSTTHKKEMNLG